MIKRQSWGNPTPNYHGSGASTPLRAVTPTGQQQIILQQPAGPPQALRVVSPSPTSSANGNSSSSADVAGVGVLFVQEEEASGFVRVTVKALIRGGSAEKSGLVQAGDMVVKVDGTDVIGQPLSVLRNLIPGPTGTYCHLGFLRGVDANAQSEANAAAASAASTPAPPPAAPAGAGFFYDVKLIRCNPNPQEFSSPSGSSSGIVAVKGGPVIYNSQEKAMRASQERARSSQDKSLKRSSFEKQGVQNVYYPPQPASNSNSNLTPQRRSISGQVTPPPPPPPVGAGMASPPMNVYPPPPPNNNNGMVNYGRSSSNSPTPYHQHPSALRAPSPNRGDSGGYSINNNVNGGGGVPGNNNHRSFDMAPHAQIARENELLRKQLKSAEESKFAAEEELKRTSTQRHEIESVLLATQDRVASLELALREAKEQAAQERTQLEHLLHKSEQMRREEEKKRQLAEHRCRQLELSSGSGSSETSGSSGFYSENKNSNGPNNYSVGQYSNNGNTNSSASSSNTINSTASTSSYGDGVPRWSAASFNSHGARNY